MDEYDNWIQTGKEEINKFLWTHLPPNMTIAEAEAISIKIFDLIDGAWIDHDTGRCAALQSR